VSALVRDDIGCARRISGSIRGSATLRVHSVGMGVKEGAPIGADSVAWGWGPGPHRDEPYGEEP